VVAEKGADYVCPKLDVDHQPVCQYVIDGAPSCLVGHVFALAGVSVDELSRVEDYAPNDTQWRPQFAAWADDAARVLLTAVQMRQDEDWPWGEAVQRAIEGDPDE
jgi:hypothetical protein